MSWLSLPLPNPFKTLQSEPPDSPPPSSCSPSHAAGVKEDLSVLGQSIGRQLRGVAAFLAPPPPPPPPSLTTSSSSAAAAEVESEEPSSMSLLGIRNDLVEIGGSLRSGLSFFSADKAVSEISRFASSFLQLEEEEGDRGEGKEEDLEDRESGACADAWRIGDEVLGFVKEMALRPECWMEFPMPLDYDFRMSDAQKKHASTVLQLAPSFSALKIKLCSHMSDSQFWMIYFILLLLRLDGRGSELLSTPEVVDARNILLQKLQNKSNSNVENSSEFNWAKDPQRDFSLSQGKEIPLDSTKISKELESGEHKDTEECGVIDARTSRSSHNRFENEDGVSFSDLEDSEDDVSSRSDFRHTQRFRAPSPSGSGEWVQLNARSDKKGGIRKVNPLSSRDKDSEDDSSNDWLAVDEFDSDSSRAA